MALFGGMDGCKAGYLLLVLDTASRGVEPLILPDAASLFARLPELRILTIDIPIELTDGPPRECDVAARRLLGRRWSSVFPTPTWPVLDAAEIDKLAVYPAYRNASVRFTPGAK